MPEKHLSTQFDTDLTALCTKLLEMGGLVESQVVRAMQGLNQMNPEVADSVMANEHRVNAAEVEIDAACASLIARRQPTARDLRLVLAVSKAVANLERAGDEAERIAKRTKHIVEDSAAHQINYAELKLSGEMAVVLLRRALDAFARLDTIAAADIVHEDRAIDEEFRGFVRKVITYMMEDPRTISVALDFLTVAKAVERIGDHAKNIAEFVIYVVKGTDVRHAPREELDREARS